MLTSKTTKKGMKVYGISPKGELVKGFILYSGKKRGFFSVQLLETKYFTGYGYANRIKIMDGTITAEPNKRLWYRYPQHWHSVDRKPVTVKDLLELRHANR